MGTGAVWIRLTHPGDGVRNHRANNPRNGSRKFNPPGSKVVLYDGSLVLCTEYTPPGAQPVRNPVNVDMFELKAKLLKDWFESASVTQVAVD